MEDNQNIVNPPLQNESNPLASNMRVNLSLPDSFDIEMVEASQLSNYELWSVVSSIMINLVVGFAVAAVTNTEPKRCALLWGVTAIFTVLFLGAIFLTVHFRRKLKKNTQVVKMVAKPETKQ